MRAKPADKPYKVADSGGLYLLVKPNGSRLWRYDYRHGGKRKTAAFGAFPEVALHTNESTGLIWVAPPRPARGVPYISSFTWP